MPPIQVVLFDLGGTLLHYEQPPARTFEILNGTAMRTFLATAAKAAMETKATRTQHANTAEDIIREGLEAVGVRLGASAWQAALAAYYASVSEGVTLVDEDAPAVLAELAGEGRGLGVVSNTLWKAEIHDADLARFGLLEYLPVRIYSSSAGVEKPHPAIYRQALDLLDVAPAEAVFVGDRLRVDVAGPQKIGMRAILVASPYRVEEDPGTQPDASIKRIAELPAVLHAWDRAIEEKAEEAGSALGLEE
jgi:putative hydrolase of the HAD superfamily